MKLIEPTTMNATAGSIARTVIQDYYTDPGPSDALTDEDNLRHIATYCRRKNAPPEPTALDFMEFESDAAHLPNN